MENLKKVREVLILPDDVDNLSECEAKQLLKGLLIQIEDRREKAKKSALKCNRKRYAGAKELRAMQEENEKIKTAISDINKEAKLKKMLIKCL